LSKGIEIPPKGHSNMVDQRSSSAPNVHNIINDANFQVSCLLPGDCFEVDVLLNVFYC